MDSVQINPEISIIVVNWNTKQMLAQCLQSVFDNLKDLSIETFVVDNGSTDGSVDLVRTEFPGVNLVENHVNVGFAKANNQAIRLCHGSYILLLNSDALLTPHAIQTIIKYFESDLSIGIAGPHLIYPDGRSQVSHGPLPTYWSEVACLCGLDKLSIEKTNHHAYEETGIVSGACMLIRKSLLDQIGLLDEAFFMFSEEVDLCNRCHKIGAKVVYVSSAMVIHAQGGSTGQTVQRVLHLYSGKLVYFYKHFGPKVMQRLHRMMAITSIGKSLIYRLLRVLSLGYIQKDDFWLSVSKELSALPK